MTTLVFSNPSPQLTGVLREIIPKLEPTARAGAIRVTGQIGTADAYELMIDSLETFLPDGGVGAGGPGVLYWLIRRPRHREVLFPRLLNLYRLPQLRAELDDAVAVYLRSGLLSAEEVIASPGVFKAILKRFRAGRSSLDKRAFKAEQAGHPGWWRDARYQERRDELITTLDVLGFVHDPKILSELTALAASADPRVRLSAITGLIRHGHPVSDHTIAALAADPETRADLHASLDRLAMTGRFPVEHYTQAAFAESRMCAWLAHRGELGRPPDTIETMGTVRLTDPHDNREMQYFVTRFRSPGVTATGDDWMAAVFGPCDPSDPPERLSGWSFSDFAAFGATPLGDHVRRIATQVQAIVTEHATR